MKLIFVYNAGSGTLHALFGLAHKIISPRTYDCALCSLTYGLFSEKQAWREFRERSPVEMVFLHKNEFEYEFKQPFGYPVILQLNDGVLTELLSAGDIGRAEDVDGLIAKIEETAGMVPVAT